MDLRKASHLNTFIVSSDAYMYGNPWSRNTSTGFHCQQCHAFKALRFWVIGWCSVGNYCRLRRIVKFGPYLRSACQMREAACLLPKQINQRMLVSLSGSVLFRTEIRKHESVAQGQWLSGCTLTNTQKKCFYILNRQYFDIMAALLRLQISQCTNHSMCTYVALETLRV